MQQVRHLYGFYRWRLRSAVCVSSHKYLLLHVRQLNHSDADAFPSVNTALLKSLFWWGCVVNSQQTSPCEFRNNVSELVRVLAGHRSDSVSAEFISAHPLLPINKYINKKLKQVCTCKSCSSRRLGDRVMVSSKSNTFVEYFRPLFKLFVFLTFSPFPVHLKPQAQLIMHTNYSRFGFS